jgi:hypothetical protein
VLPAVINAGDLAAESRSLIERLEQERAACRAADAALEVTLTPEQIALCHKASDAASDRTTTYHEPVSAEMARHAPAISTAIRLLWLHVLETPTKFLGECCTPETGYSL